MGSDVSDECEASIFRIYNPEGDHWSCTFHETLKIDVSETCRRRTFLLPNVVVQLIRVWGWGRKLGLSFKLL